MVTTDNNTVSLKFAKRVQLKCFQKKKKEVEDASFCINCKKKIEKKHKNYLKILTAHNPNTQSTTSIILTIII